MPLRGTVIPHCSGKCFSFHFSSAYHLVFAAAVKKVHLPLRVVPIINFRRYEFNEQWKKTAEKEVLKAALRLAKTTVAKAKLDSVNGL